jgi:hypothetical protein
MRPPLTIDYQSDDRLTAPEPVAIYGTGEGEVFAWFPYSNYGPVVPPDLPIFRFPKVMPLVYRAPAPKPIAIGKLDEMEPWVLSDPTYRVTIREWAVWMQGKQYRWAVSVYCAFDAAAGDWIVCGEPHQTYEPVFHDR